jgi:hypothetical protein
MYTIITVTTGAGKSGERACIAIKPRETKSLQPPLINDPVKVIIDGKKATVCIIRLTILFMRGKKLTVWRNGPLYASMTLRTHSVDQAKITNRKL